MKIFNSAMTNATTDITTMAKRHAAASTVSTGSNVYVSFDGLVELLHGPLVQPGTAMHVPESPKTWRTVNPLKWLKMSLEDFCRDYEVPDSLHNKLQKLCIQGPHALCWISDNVLCQEGGLALSELGTLRDAEQCWKNYFTWDD
jgi:hypothetical protein